MKYRITNPEPGMFSPAVKKCWWGRWVSPDGNGCEMPWGWRWSGPLGCATHSVSVHGQINDVVVAPIDEILYASS